MTGHDDITYNISGKSFTAVAINCAAKTGEWIKSKLGEIKNIQVKSSSRDLVTEVDKGAEMMIRQLIQTHFPLHAFLGEEDTAKYGIDSLSFGEYQQIEYLWIVDPIDGTTNYIHGFPNYCVSIALAHKGEIIVGVIYDPSRDEMFVAEKGKGVYVHGMSMKVSQERQLSESLFVTDIFTSKDKWSRHLHTMASKTRDIRCLGSAALHLAYVAAGRVSGFWQEGLKVWDIAAGALLVMEAGGCITDWDGQAYQLDKCHILATNGYVHEEALHVLQVRQAK